MLDIPLNIDPPVCRAYQLAGHNLRELDIRWMGAFQSELNLLLTMATGTMRLHIHCVPEEGGGCARDQ